MSTEFRLIFVASILAAAACTPCSTTGSAPDAGVDAVGIGGSGGSFCGPSWSSSASTATTGTGSMSGCDQGYGGAPAGSVYNAGFACAAKFCKLGQAAFACGQAVHCTAPFAGCTEAREAQNYAGAGIGGADPDDDGGTDDDVDATGYCCDVPACP